MQQRKMNQTLRQSLEDGQTVASNRERRFKETEEAKWNCTAAGCDDVWLGVVAAGAKANHDALGTWAKGQSAACAKSTGIRRADNSHAARPRQLVLGSASWMVECRQYMVFTPPSTCSVTAILLPILLPTLSIASVSLFYPSCRPRRSRSS